MTHLPCFIHYTAERKLAQDLFHFSTRTAFCRAAYDGKRESGGDLTQNTTHHITIIGGDLRYGYAARNLRQAGWLVDMFQVQRSPDSVDAASLFRSAQTFLLPYPAFNAKGYVPFLQGETILHCSDIAAQCTPEMTLFCGRPGPCAEVLRQTGARVIDYEQDAFLTAANAVPTAEGAIQIAMEQMDDTIWQSECLVIGFGRIGKLLSARLHRLGAHVTVAARNPADQALIAAFGMQHDTTAHYQLPLARYQLIVNTVPAPIFTAEQYAQLDPSCIIIDLASAPGGIDASKCLKHNLNFTHARGLPGKIAPATAGQLIAQSVLRSIDQKEAP